MGARQIIESTNRQTPEGAFTSGFLATLRATSEAAQSNRGRVSKNVDAGTIADALTPELLARVPATVHGTRILLVSNVNGKPLSVGEAATGRRPDSGDWLIALYPSTGNEVVAALVHEIKHVIDRHKGKDVSVTGVQPANRAAYRRLPSERRAQRFEKSFLR